MDKASKHIMHDDIAYWKDQVENSPISSNILGRIYAYYYSNEAEECIRQIEDFLSFSNRSEDNLDRGTALLLRDNIRAEYASFVNSGIYSVREDTILTDTLYQDIIERYLHSDDSYEREIGEVAHIRRILFQVSHGHFREIAKMYPDYIHFDEALLADDTLFSGEGRTAGYFDMYQLVVGQLVLSLEGKSGKHYECCRVFLETKGLDRMCMNLSLGITPELEAIYKKTLEQGKKLLIQGLQSTNPEIQFLAYRKIYGHITSLLNHEEHIEFIHTTKDAIQELPFYGAIYSYISNLSFAATYYRCIPDYKKAIPYYSEIVGIREGVYSNKISNVRYTLTDILLKRGFCFLKLGEHKKAEHDFKRIIAMRSSIDMTDYEQRQFYMMAYGNLTENSLLASNIDDTEKICIEWIDSIKEISESPLYTTIAYFIRWIIAQGDEEKQRLNDLGNVIDALDRGYFDWGFDEIKIYTKTLPKEKQKKIQQVIDYLGYKIPKEECLWLFSGGIG